ncbi:hypothetical protein ABZ547_22085 [Streptomyces sparsogenes]|uniref:hypothetical protein n=1 Tax=Streptomyces sparsogenes TaxID=67365 RepID=UPI0033CFBECE
MESPEITIKLTPDEALVLSDWLEQVQMTGLSRLVDDAAAWVPLHRIAGILGKSLPGIFAADHAEWLEAARSRLRPAMDDSARDEEGAATEACPRPLSEMTERQYLASVGQRPGLFTGKASFHMLTAFLTGYDQHAHRLARLARRPSRTRLQPRLARPGPPRRPPEPPARDAARRRHD